MNEFAIRVDRLTERLRRDTARCDQIEQQACLVEERLTTLNQSVVTLARLIEVSLLIVAASDRDKVAWLTTTENGNDQLNNPIVARFFHRLESSMERSIVGDEEKRAYIQALSLVHRPSIVSSRFSLK